MSAVPFSAHVIGYVGDLRSFDNSDLAEARWNRYNWEHLPKAPLSLITGTDSVFLNQSYDHDAFYDDESIHEEGDTLGKRLTFMLTNPTASLRFCPETGFSFDDPDETIFRLSRS